MAGAATGATVVGSVGVDINTDTRGDSGGGDRVGSGH